MTERQPKLTKDSSAEEISTNSMKFAKPRELKSNDYPDSCMTQPEMLRKLIAEKKCQRQAVFRQEHRDIENRKEKEEQKDKD